MTESNEPQQELGDLDDWIFRVFNNDDELLDAICPEDSTPPSDLPEPEPSGALRLSRQEATAGVQRVPVHLRGPRVRNCMDWRR